MKNVEVSPKFEILHACLALAYGTTLLGVFLHMLFRTSTQRPEFNFFVMIGLLTRTIWLVLQNFVYNGTFGDLSGWRGGLFLLNSVPNFFFFSCFLTVLFLWMRLYHQGGMDDGGPQAQARRWSYRRVFTLINVLLYSILFALYVWDYESMGPHMAFKGVVLMTQAETWIMCLDGLLYAVLALMFIIYGALFWHQLASSIQHFSIVRRNILRKVQLLTLLVSVFFTVRLAIIIWSMYSDAWNVWYFDLLYFGGLELIPLILALLIIHRRVDPSSSRSGLPRTPQHHRHRSQSVVTPRLSAAKHLLSNDGDFREDPDAPRPWWWSSYVSDIPGTPGIQNDV